MAGFPIQQPDPNNPGQVRWVDSQTGQPVPAPGPPPNANLISTGQPVSTVAPPTTAPTTPAATSTPPAQTPQRDASSGNYPGAASTSTSRTVTPSGPPGPDGKPTFSLQDAVAQTQLDANAAYLAATQAGNDANTALQAQRDFEAGKGGPNHDQGIYDSTGVRPNPAYQAAISQATNAYTQSVATQNRLTQANQAKSDALVKAAGEAGIDPALSDKYTQEAAQAKAAAGEADARAKDLANTSDANKGLALANATKATSEAGVQDATAAQILARTPAEVDELRAQTKALGAQGDQAAANVNLINAQATLTAGATTDETRARAVLDTATANAQQASADLTQANIAAGKPAADVTGTLAQAAANQATAQQTLESIRQKQLGPLYGLQDQINTIKNTIFGPGGSGTIDERTQQANDLLNQYITATIGGTTPFEASKALAGQQSIDYGTQMAGTNALQAAQANRANAYAGFGGSVLGTLAQMNQYAPKGSTGMADAFQGVMNAMASRMAPEGFGPTQIPTPPPMPSFLAAFAAGHQAGTAQATAAQAQGGGGQAPTVNVNVNGQPQYGAGPGGTVQMPYIPGAPGVTSGVTSGAGPGGAIPMQGAPTTTGTPTGPQQTPQQAFDQGYAANQPSIPNFASMYGLNMPSPLAMLGGKPYIGMGPYNQGPGPGTPTAGSLLY